MREVLFEWDDEKARNNLIKHGVSFEEAKFVLTDPFSVTIPDREHSDNEDRWLDVGLTEAGKILVVCYTERGDTLRIIGCRYATATEQRIYEDENKRQRQG